GRDVARVEDRLAVMREGGLAQLLLQLLAGALDQRHPAAARYVVEPDLSGPQRTPGREVLLGRDEAAVSAPGRLIEQAEVLLGHLALVGPVEVHHPDVVAAAAVGGEGDALSVRREARLHFPGQALGDPCRRPARDRHGVDVAQKVEGDRLPVRADVDVHPGAFVDVDRRLAHGDPGRRVDVPFGLGRGRRRRNLGLGLSRAENGDENRCEPECHEAPHWRPSVANPIGGAMEGYAPGRTLLSGSRANTAAPAAAKAAAPNRSSTRARDAAPIAASRCGCASRVISARARASGSSGGTTRPVLPGLTVQGSSPTAETIVGRPACMASWAAMQSPSARDGCRYRCRLARNSRGSSSYPG